MDQLLNAIENTNNLVKDLIAKLSKENVNTHTNAKPVEIAVQSIKDANTEVGPDVKCTRVKYSPLNNQTSEDEEELD